MFKSRFVLLILLIAVTVTGCASTGSTVTSHDAAVETTRGLVGAWLVSASRAGGKGVLLVTFTSDGTFIRSATSLSYCFLNLTPEGT
jgi:hypothetical protein